MCAAPVLSVRNLRRALSPEFAVSIDDLEMQRGDYVFMDAPSGAGKSTALGLISGAIAPDTVSDQHHAILGQRVTPELPRSAFFSPDKVGFVLQTNALVPYLTIAANIRLPCDVAEREVDTDWERHVQTALGIRDLLHRKPAEISVGQRQRASIARAFLARPALLLLDEPVSALDPANVAQVEGLIEVLAEEARTAVLLASHQPSRSAFQTARRLAFETRREGVHTVSAFSLCNSDRLEERSV